MSRANQTNESLNFIIIVLLLVVMSLVGMITPESVSRLQGSNPLKWTVAILCGSLLSYILAWLSRAALDSGNLQSKSRSHYVREIMITDLGRVLHFQPFLVLLVGWILGWGVNEIIGVVSFLIFVTVCASFFRALRQWELREKKHRVSLQT